jgi:hypothetical protein
MLTRGTLAEPNNRFFPEAGSVTANEVEALSEASEVLRRRIWAFLDDPGQAPRIDYHIYPSFEAKGLATGNTQLRHADPDSDQIHMVINAWIRGDDALADARLLVRRGLGMPETHALDLGLAMFFTREWRGRGYEYWVARLYRSGNLLPLADLLDNSTFMRQSYLVASPLVGSFVSFIVDSFGKRVLLDNYRHWRPSGPDEIERLEKGWHLYLDSLAAQYDGEARADRDRFPRASGFRKGFCHAHEGYSIYNGYLSEASDAALGKLAALGTNSVSITPFSYMRDPRKPVALPFSHASEAENDECVIHAANTAHELGMSVMLKPHIWLGHSWPGAIAMTNAKDWEKFFAYYKRWILHYALLAEMYDIEMLCVGVELVRTTISHEDEWRAIIASVRRLYSGAIVYAANWGEEFENIAFWDALDYIGINCYYPLAEDDAASFDELKRGARSIFQRIRAVHQVYDRPVLITEIGFTATSTPWKKPHQPVRRRQAQADGLEHQALCYRAVLEELYGADWCDGVFWWKWPSFLEYGGPRDPDFTPNGKPAEDVIRDWYSRRW